MGDHFVLLVDRLLTESTLEAAIENKNRLQHCTPSESEFTVKEYYSHRMDVNRGTSPRILVECRICHDEDEDSNMEIPCSCCGSLKYAHRKCVQRWCNEKGDLICEICRQQFKSGYTAPPPLYHYDGIPTNFRENWEVSRRDLHNPQFVATVASDQNFLDPVFDDYSAPTSRSQICCRVVAVILVVLLLLRHTLPVIISGAGEYAISLLALLMLRTISIFLPIYIMVKAFYVFQRRRRHQQETRNVSLSPSDDENEPPQQLQPQPHFIHIQ